MLKIQAEFFSPSVKFSEAYGRSPLCFLLFTVKVTKSQMTLKIETVVDGQKTLIRLSGRLQSEHLDELRHN